MEDQIKNEITQIHTTFCNTEASDSYEANITDFTSFYLHSSFILKLHCVLSGYS